MKLQVFLIVTKTIEKMSNITRLIVNNILYRRINVSHFFYNKITQNIVADK